MAESTLPFGPLTPFIGAWTGTGVDTVPDGHGGSIRTDFLQRVVFEAGPILNFGQQTVRALRYACTDWSTDDKVAPTTMFPVYEENGYFIWIPEENTVALQVSNPRGLSMLAAGTPHADGVIKVSTQTGNSGQGVLVSRYLTQFENIKGYEAELRLLATNHLWYAKNTLLTLADSSIFNQTDISHLRRYSQQPVE